MKCRIAKLALPVSCVLTLCVLSLCAVLFALDKPAALGAHRNSPKGMPTAAGDSTIQTSAKKSTAAQQRALTAFGNLPLAFQPNQGQTDAQVKYMTHWQGYDLFLTSNQAVFTLPMAQENSTAANLAREKQTAVAAKHSTDHAADSSVTGSVLRMTMLGANSQPAISGEQQEPGKYNYFIGRDPKNWHTNVPLFARVHYRDVYPGIDVVYHGARQVEFDLVVKPGANPNQVELGFDGAKQMKTDASGNLVLTSEAGDLQMARPVAYQEKNGVRQMVDARFVVNQDHRVAFALGAYDRSRELVIDPPIAVAYATYLGGSGEEAATGINVDPAGNAYVTGGTNSTSFPGYTGKLNGKLHAYVTQITAAGALGYTTVVGGSSNDYNQAIAIDSQYLYITGATSSTDFPVTGGAAQTTYGGGTTDGFVVKLKLDGTSRVWATYLGGSGADVAFGIALDASGNVFVAGETHSTDFPVANSLPQGGSNSGSADGFVTEVNNNGSQFLVSSYIGGTGLDLATGISWNAATGHVYVGGSTQSPNLPVTAGAFQSSCGTDGNCNNGANGPEDDAFVAAFDPTNTSQYAFLTYVGGELSDDSTALTTDATGNVYITGKTDSTLYPVLNSLPGQSSLLGPQNAFITALKPDGTGLVYSTYLGGSGFDKGLGVVVDSNNDAYVTGTTSSTDFPTQDPSQQNFGGGNSGQFDSDAFVTEVNWDSGSNTLSLIFSTYLGGAGDEDILGGFVSIDSNENIYVIGDTNSTNFPVQAPLNGTVIDPSLNGGVSKQPICTVKDRNQNPLQVVCPDSFVAMYGFNTEGVIVTFVGSGSGTVTSSPAGMNCTGNPCGGSFPTGTVVTLTAAPASNSAFVGWSGAGCSGTGTCSVLLNSNQFVSVDFNAVSAPLKVTTVGPGTVTSSPAGIDCPTTCSANFPINSKVTLTAKASSGASFTGWSGACSGTGSCSVTMNQAQAVTATFQGFSLSATALSPSSVQPGGSAESTVTVNSVGGFDPTKVTLSCEVAPAVSFAPTCHFGSINSSGVSTLTVNTTAQSAMVVMHSGIMYATFLPIGGMAFLGVGLGAGSRKKKLLGLLLLCLVLSGLMFLAACGSGGGGTGGSGNGTPANSYTITVKGTASGFTQGGTAPELTLTVQ